MNFATNNFLNNIVGERERVCVCARRRRRQIVLQRLNIAKIAYHRLMKNHKRVIYDEIYVLHLYKMAIINAQLHLHNAELSLLSSAMQNYGNACNVLVIVYIIFVFFFIFKSNQLMYEAH